MWQPDGWGQIRIGVLTPHADDDESAPAPGYAEQSKPVSSHSQQSTLPLLLAHFVADARSR